MEMGAAKCLSGINHVARVSELMIVILVLVSVYSYSLVFYIYWRARYGRSKKQYFFSKDSFRSALAKVETAQY